MKLYKARCLENGEISNVIFDVMKSEIVVEHW